MAGDLISPVMRAPKPASRVPSLLAFGAIVLATIALLSNTEFHANDALLQTAQAQPMLAAPQVPVATAVPVQGLQEAAPAEPAAAAPAEPAAAEPAAAEPAAAAPVEPAAAAPAEPAAVAPVAPAAAAPMQPAGPMPGAMAEPVAAAGETAVPPPPATGNPSADIFNVPAGSGLAAPLPPPAPLCAGGGATCENAQCVETNSVGCLVPDATGQMDCNCPPPPPPPPAPVIGSPGWLSLPENQIEAPGPAAMAGANLAAYKMGDISIQLARYLKNTASKAEAQAEIADIVRDEIKRMHMQGQAVPEGGEAAPAAEEGGEEPGKSKGILGLGFFGLAETGSTSGAAAESKMTVGEAQTVASDVAKIIQEDPDMPASTKGELKELQNEAANYNNAGALRSSLISVLLAAVLALLSVY